MNKINIIRLSKFSKHHHLVSLNRSLKKNIVYFMSRKFTKKKIDSEDFYEPWISLNFGNNDELLIFRLNYHRYLYIKYFKSLLIFALCGYLIYNFIDKYKRRGFFKNTFMFLIVLLSVILVKYHIYNMKVTGKEIFLMKNGHQIKFNTIFNDVKRVYHI